MARKSKSRYAGICMAKLNVSRRQLHERIYALRDRLNESQRQAVEDLVWGLSSRGQWYPKHFRESLKELDASGVLSKFERDAVYREFFPEG
jgi:hypothetical protein